MVVMAAANTNIEANLELRAPGVSAIYGIATTAGEDTKHLDLASACRTALRLLADYAVRGTNHLAPFYFLHTLCGSIAIVIRTVKEVRIVGATKTQCLCLRIVQIDRSHSCWCGCGWGRRRPPVTRFTGLRPL